MRYGLLLIVSLFFHCLLASPHLANFLYLPSDPQQAVLLGNGLGRAGNFSYASNQQRLNAGSLSHYRPTKRVDLMEQILKHFSSFDIYFQHYLGEVLLKEMNPAAHQDGIYFASLMTSDENAKQLEAHYGINHPFTSAVNLGLKFFSQYLYSNKEIPFTLVALEESSLDKLPSDLHVVATQELNERLNLFHSEDQNAKMEGLARLALPLLFEGKVFNWHQKQSVEMQFNLKLPGALLLREHPLAKGEISSRYVDFNRVGYVGSEQSIIDISLQKVFSINDEKSQYHLDVSFNDDALVLEGDLNWKHESEHWWVRHFVNRINSGMQGTKLRIHFKKLRFDFIRPIEGNDLIVENEFDLDMQPEESKIFYEVFSDNTSFSQRMFLRGLGFHCDYEGGGEIYRCKKVYDHPSFLKNMYDSYLEEETENTIKRKVKLFDSEFRSGMNEFIFQLLRVFKKA